MLDNKKLISLDKKSIDRRKMEDNRKFLQKMQMDSNLLNLYSIKRQAERKVFGGPVKRWFFKTFLGRDLRIEFVQLTKNKAKMAKFQEETLMLQDLLRRKEAINRLEGNKIRAFIMVHILGKDPYMDPYLNITIVKRNEKKSTSEDTVPRSSSNKASPGSKGD